MLIRIFYDDLQKDIHLADKDCFTIGSSQGDTFPVLNMDLVTAHISITCEYNVWQIQCNGSVFRGGQPICHEEVHFSEIYVLSTCYQISVLCIDDSKMNKTVIALPEDGEIRLGRGTDNQIVFGCSLVSKHHADIDMEDSHCVIRDLHSTNGTYINGRRITECVLHQSDELAIGEFKLIFDKLALTIHHVAPVSFAQEMMINEKTVSGGKRLFVRSPRLQRQLPRGTVEIQTPPSIGTAPEINKLTTALPALGSVGISIAFALATGNPLMMLYTLPMTGIGMTTSFLNYNGKQKKFRKLTETKRNKYEEHLESVENQLQDLMRAQREALLTSDPDLSTCFHSVYAMDGRLWDRKPSDLDFMSVRIGTGEICASYHIEEPKSDISVEEDRLVKEAQQLCQKYKYIQQAPITFSVLQNQVCGIVGSQMSRFQLLNNIAAQITTHHCYTEVKLVVIYDQAHSDRFGWMSALPHVRDTDYPCHFVATTKADAEKLFKEITQEFSMRKAEMEGDDSFGAVSVCVPYYLFLIAEPAFLSRNDPITEYLFHNKNLGAGVIMAVDQLVQLPKECGLMIELERDHGKIYEREDASSVQNFELESADNVDFGCFSNAMSHIRCNEGIKRDELAENYGFFEMIGVKTAAEIDLEKLWRENDVTKSMAAPLGIGMHGEVILDVHENAHGPHGLVAGTTGSGKSELLQSYILAMAIHYHPYDVGFVIIDFKGGGMANQFANLPHVRGIVTNISNGEINRFLASVRAELIKRQRLFAKCPENVKNIDQYISLYKQGKVSEPLPHLIIVVDEFAELKSEHPEFMKELVSASRIGRSLGIHLILATQKPAGQVNDQIWSNARFHLCLKVATREDSTEVLKSPVAFNIKNAGRAYIQVGNNEIFELFQSAYSGADVTEAGVKRTQLEAVVNHISDFCRKHKIDKLPEICIPPLPECIPYSDQLMKRNGHLDVCVGRYDFPDRQIQGEVLLDLAAENTAVIGASQSGKTNVLQTIIRSGSSHYSSDLLNFYIMDFGSMILKNFEGLAHVGGVVLSNEDEKAENLFKMLREEIARRKKLFVNIGISSYTSYLDATDERLPFISLMIDNLTALQEFIPAASEDVLFISREGLTVGIGIIFTNIQTVGIGYKTMMNFSRHIALHCNDGNEYINLFERSCLQIENIPGRSLTELDHGLVSTQMYLSFNGEREIDRVQEIKSFISRTNTDNSGQIAAKIPVMPEFVTQDYLDQENYCSRAKDYCVPLGLDYANMELYSMDLFRNGIVAISGEEQSGKSNLTMQILASIQERIFENETIVYLADETGSLKNAADLGCVQEFVQTSAEAKGIVEKAYEILQDRKENWNPESAGSEPALMVVLSGIDLISELLRDAKINDAIMEIIRESKKFHTFVVLSELSNEGIGYSAPTVLKYVKENNCILALCNICEIRLVDVPLKLQSKFAKEISTGDGYSLLGGKVRKLRFIYYIPEQG